MPPFGQWHFLRAEIEDRPLHGYLDVRALSAVHLNQVPEETHVDGSQSHK
jgi:hypothetical protein